MFNNNVNNSMSSKAKNFCDNDHCFTICIEGNIGSGKTTFLDHLQAFDEKICRITEPVDDWRDMQGVNLLDLMHKQPDRWAMPFQSYVTLSMLQKHILKTDKPIKLMERSLHSARHCFVENMYLNKIIEPGMYYILQEWYDFVEKHMDVKVDLIVYLRTTPEVAYERMRKRGRLEERSVTMKYVEDIHRLHEKWLIENRAYNTNVIVLNADLDMDDIGMEYKRFENHINGAFTQHQPQAVLVSPSKR